MKRYKAYKTLKRPKFLTRPVATADIPLVDKDSSYENSWLMRLEKRETRQFRRFKQQHA